MRPDWTVLTERTERMKAFTKQMRNELNNKKTRNVRREKKFWQDVGCATSYLLNTDKQSLISS